jgi:hypothetical protein
VALTIPENLALMTERHTGLREWVSGEQRDEAADLRRPAASRAPDASRE